MNPIILFWFFIRFKRKKLEKKVQMQQPILYSFNWSFFVRASELNENRTKQNKKKLSMWIWKKNLRIRIVCMWGKNWCFSFFVARFFLDLAVLRLLFPAIRGSFRPNHGCFFSHFWIWLMRCRFRLTSSPHTLTIKTRENSKEFFEKKTANINNIGIMIIIIMVKQ